MTEATGRAATPRRFGAYGLGLLAIVVILVAYTTTIWFALGLSIGPALVGGVANTVPIVIFGALARRIIRTWLIGQPAIVQIIGHAALCAGFAMLSFWLLLVLLGVVNGISATEFIVRPFAGAGTAWQMLENVTTYGMIAALAYFPIHTPDPIPIAQPASTVLPEPEERRDPETSRYFIRSGDDLRPIDFARIISVAGADDYAEVTSLDGKHLVRMTLAEFEKALDPATFVRVHRSSIVNVDHIVRAEPAGGGRMLLHMQNGEMISASRTGSRLLRDRVI
jgi:two-component system, LytTR family, response regulator